MSKAFKIQDSIGNTWEGNKTCWAEARNIALQAKGEGGDIEYSFFYYGADVGFEKFISATQEVEDEKYQKKTETHKQVWIPDGVAFAATKKYQQVWVRK